MPGTSSGDAFTAERARLVGLAYRVTGSRAEAEDIVQDAWIRWRARRPDDDRTPGGVADHRHGPPGPRSAQGGPPHRARRTSVRGCLTPSPPGPGRRTGPCSPSR